MNQNLSWKIVDWEGLTKDDLYALLSLRAEVFVVEQDCPYQDVDGKDQKSLHVLGFDELGDLIAYSRVVLAGISYPEISIGRVVTHPEKRKGGMGKALMQATLDAIQDQFDNPPIRISAQEYLIQFYEAFGFEQVSEMYLEDDIPHVEMLKTKW